MAGMQGVCVCAASQLEYNHNPTRGGVLEAARIQEGVVVVQDRVQKSSSATSRCKATP